MISPEHLVDFEQELQIHVSNPNDKRRLKRGNKGQRDVRPNAERFLNSDNFQLEFKALTTAKDYGSGTGKWKTGGQWLGTEYLFALNGKTFPLQVLVDGIMAFIKDHELEKLNEVQHKL